MFVPVADCRALRREASAETPTTLTVGENPGGKLDAARGSGVEIHDREAVERLLSE